MKIAIVGSSRLDVLECDKAIIKIWELMENKDDEYITGDAKGIDSIVRDIGKYRNVTVVKAKNKHWIPHGFKERNEKIAQQADIVYSIATKKIKDKRCYHCDEQDHDRTGGCWTKRYAMDKLHKDGETIII